MAARSSADGLFDLLEHESLRRLAPNTAFMVAVDGSRALL